MKTISKQLVKWSAGLAAALMCISSAQAATYSSTKAEVLYGFDYPRGADFADDDQATLTIANATGFTWGDSYVFLDVGNLNDSDSTGGAHIEWSTRVRLWKSDSMISAGYVIGQVDLDSGRFANKITKQIGLSLDWAVPGFNFVTTSFQLRDDPTFDGSATQFTLVWNKGFNIGEQNFSFDGFLDWTSSEGSSASNVLTQPALMWLPTKHFGVGIEYQYWKNRIGIEGYDEKAPQIMGRWTF